MKSKYYPPIHGESKFNCIFCNVYSAQSWFDTRLITQQYFATEIRACQCNHCHKWSFWHNGVMVVPDASPVEPVHHDLPEDCKLDYEEARSIISKSPRAAAALLRLVIQKLCAHLGESGANINNDIKSLVTKGLSPLVQKALDYCRVVGNNAVHPGEIDINDTPETAHKLFQMINFIVEDRITRPMEIQTLYAQLPESAIAAIEKRDSTSVNKSKD